MRNKCTDINVQISLEVGGAEARAAELALRIPTRFPRNAALMESKAEQENLLCGLTECGSGHMTRVCRRQKSLVTTERRLHQGATTF